MEYKEIILLMPYIIVFLIGIVHLILQYYMTYSKKYKNLKILEKVSEIAKNNKKIYIIDYYILKYLAIIVFFLLVLICFFSNINLFCRYVDIISWIIIDINIWMLSFLITNVYHILVYIKVMKAEKS